MKRKALFLAIFIAGVLSLTANNQASAQQIVLATRAYISSVYNPGTGQIQVVDTRTGEVRRVIDYHRPMPTALASTARQVPASSVVSPPPVQAMISAPKRMERVALHKVAQPPNPLPPAPQPSPPPPIKTARTSLAPKPPIQVASIPASAKPAVPATPAPVAKPATPNRDIPEREVRTQYYLFDPRGPEEVGQLANRFQRESAGGNMIVQDLQDRSREYEVPKAMFFRMEYAVPTRELLDSSNALRMSNSPGYTEKKN